MEELLRQLVIANANQQQANAEQKLANAEQKRANEQVLRCLESQQQAQQQAQQAQQQAQQAQQQSEARFLELLQKQDQRLQQQVEAILQQRQQTSETSGSTNTPSICVSRLLPKMTGEDDPEAFVTTFERTAEREKWPKEQWAGLVAPLLSGESQKAYFDLEPEQAKNYDVLKAEILARLGVTLAVRANRVNDWTFELRKPPRSQMYDLIHLTRKWLQPETLNAPKIVERIVMDRFLRSLPLAIQRWVNHGDPATADQLVDLVERYLATENLTSAPRDSRTFRPKTRPNPMAGKTVSRGEGGESVRGESFPKVWRELPGKSRPREAGKGVICFRCRQEGHIATNCPVVDEPMQCDFLRDRRQSLYATVACTAIRGPEKHLCRMCINGSDVVVLLDSGSLVTLVKAELITTKMLGHKKVAVICVHGDTREYPIATVLFETPKGNLCHQVGLVSHLPHDAIVGRDFPKFWELWECPDPPTVALVNQDWESQNSPESAEGSPEFPLSVLAGETPETGEEPTASDETLPPIEFADLEVHRENFATEQVKDPSLMRARENVLKIDGELVNPAGTCAYPYFMVERDLLYRVVQRAEETLEQLVVPRPYRKLVLQLAHGHILGGHLGVEKTRERILHRFYWPGVIKEVEDYCSSCPVCQRTAPMPHFRNPLVPLPIIEVPFERLAMDLVGPLVKSARGHQYILVIMDYATRYPEAIPLRNASAKTIAKELFLVLSRVGICKELLTDQGTPFMSRVMKELCKLLKVTQLRTSVYHPQTDGLVERFNKTLKQMLRKVVDRDGRDWDCLIPYLMFAIREVPQSSTGFSPFELLYGRHPRGLLDVAKETWESESSPHRSVIEHVMQMQDRIANVMPIVKEHLAQAQLAQQRIYNRGAQTRTFAPGDRVLVLIPTVESKFLAKWQGPYEILEQVSAVNYRVSQPGRRKPEQVYHVNLLKAWRDRESLVAETVSPTQAAGLVPEVRIAVTLSKSQHQEVKEFVLRNREIFSELPGHTSGVEHDIITPPGERVKLKPYRIPEARREVIREEVQRMMELGVIEESQSDWSSPIVLVPKPDGSWRFCNDFRQLNKVTKFDTYPMPRIDELIDRLGTARYMTTLDLTKGYWQIPLAKPAREKTAFVTPDGAFQYRRMPFGLQNAPATFQRLMDRVLRAHQKYAAAYLDDVIIHSPDWASHLPKVQAVLDSLREAGFTANPKKCTIGQEEAKYLGYTIGRGVIQPQINKVEAIQSWPRPNNKKQVRAFLGIAGYYRRFIPHFASQAVPLTNLTKGKECVMVKWSSEAETAFQGLKTALCNQPVLYSPDFSKDFVVQTDASDVGLGAVLSQVWDGEEHPVIYLSRKLNSHEVNYATIEKECLAVKWALDSLRYYLLGRHFDLVTDHAPLKWMAQNRETNRRVNRWFLALQEYSFSVSHRPGVKMGNADALSRVHACLLACVPTPSLKHGGGVCDSRKTHFPGIVQEGIYVSPRFRSYVDHFH